MKAVIPFVTQLADDGTAWLHALRAVMPEHNLSPLEELTAEQCAAAEVAIVVNPDPADLADLPNLKWVQSLWAGVEGLLADTRDANFAIVRMTDPQLAETMAEAVLAWTFYLHRDMPRYRKQQLDRIWRQHPLPLPHQRTVGLLGLGNMGKAAAKRLLQQGFKVCGWSRSQIDIEGVETVSGADGLPQVLQRSNILVCLLPLTNQTHGLLNHDTLGLLPNGASLINFARGPIVDTQALITHLNSGRLSHAVLDVFDQEPLSPQSPLWSHPNITILPHISAPTNKQTAAAIAAKNINRYLSKGEIPPSVDRTRGY
ncbi:MAG: glyoxylate/hydroxypyruvate reductase A [Leptolyngbyaceae cyanobacterium MO_188.B28]|nr:glyoxylate/hydroxypyruvate reductase A [Leptolyngbyaceae cyanobacterium MO_188.B28]